MRIARRQFKIYLSIIMVVVFIVLSCFRYQYINTKYPNPTIKEHFIDEPFVYQEVELLFEDFNIFGYDEFLVEYNLNPERMDMVIPGAEQKNAIFTLHIKNPSNTKKKISTAELMLLQTSGWTSYTDLMDSFRLLNDNRSHLVELDPGEEDTLKFSYCLYDKSFSKKDFANIERQDFSVVLSIYPVKTIVRLN